MKKINVLVPDLPESISDATVVKWHIKEGELVQYDDNIVDIETDKVMLEVSAPSHGKLEKIIEKEGSIVKSQQILGYISELDNNLSKEKIALQEKNQIKKSKNEYFSPSIRRLMKITSHDHLNKKTLINTEKEELHQNICNKSMIDQKEDDIFENRVPMSRLRQRISERLLYSIQNTAMLTTFNEVNMKPIILLRKQYGETFQKEHGVRIGFMSFFVKAVIQALKKFPEVNASIDKTEIVYYKNFDISIAISTPRGLITPVLKNADKMTMSEIEKKIKEFSIKGFENKINIQELTGGNFTITNGGIFGSLMSTPIINPPQTAILGMHTIQDRAMVVNGKIKILPMMYLALSYDHRLIDGKESVGFLVTIKNILEDFARISMNI